MTEITAEEMNEVISPTIKTTSLFDIFVELFENDYVNVFEKEFVLFISEGKKNLNASNEVGKF